MSEELEPISKELLKNDQLLCLSLPTSSEKIKVYTLLIKRSAPVRKTVTEMLPISPQGTVEADKLGENGHNSQVPSPGDSVYRLDENTAPLKIYHFGQAWRPDDIEIYWENPNPELASGWVRDVAISEEADEGFVLSKNTRYSEDMPSTELETIIVPGVTPFIGFQNNHLRLTQTPTALFLGRAYDITPINKVDKQKAKDIALGKGYKRSLKSFGPLSTYDISIPDEWGEEIEIEPTELVNALGGGR